MQIKHILLIGLLSLSVLSGCARHLTKTDSAAAAPPATTTQAADPTPAANTAKATAPTSTSDAPIASKAPAPDKTAKTTPAKAEVKAPTAQDTTTAAKLLPLPPKEIVDAIKTLTHHPRVRYLSRTAQYDYYVGGRVDAKFDINKNQLLVTNAPTEVKSPITCAYAANGDMLSGKKTDSSQQIAECNKLVNELTDYMAR